MLSKVAYSASSYIFVPHSIIQSLKTTKHHLAELEIATIQISTLIKLICNSHLFSYTKPPDFYIECEDDLPPYKTL